CDDAGGVLPRRAGERMERAVSARRAGSTSVRGLASLLTPPQAREMNIRFAIRRLAAEAALVVISLAPRLVAQAPQLAETAVILAPEQQIAAAVTALPADRR